MEREKKIDILKSIGVVLIILAHICSSKVIMQLRNFDVPLMVLVSGYLSVNSFKKSNSLFQYYKKRLIRLIVPTYIFLIIFFVIVKLLNFNAQYPFDMKMIIRTFLLLDGIGYVWIIRVYVLCAFAAPILIYIMNKVSKRTIIISAIVIYSAYEFVNYFFAENLNVIFKYVINYLISYSLILYIGMETKKLSNKKITALALMFLAIFVVLLIVNYKIYGKFIATQTMKYPPRLYYVSYALTISMFLFSILDNEMIVNKIYNSTILFISKNSLWIYLWHILYIYILSKTLIQSWIIKFIIVLICTITTVKLQQIVVNFLEDRNINKNILNIFKG